MSKLTGFALTFTAAGVFALGPALAQSSGSSQSESKSKAASGQREGTGTDQASSSQSQSGQQLASAERQFLIKAAQGNMAEAALGKLAQERGSSQQVKDLGKQLEDDHQKAFTEVQRIAQGKGVNLPQTPDKKHQQVHDRLSKLSGDQFDRAFLKQVHQEHNRDIKEFERMSQRARDDEVKQFASNTLTELRKHHDMAQQGMTALGGGRSSGIRTDEAGSTGRKDKQQGERKP